jgi:hypothetical protein
MFVPSMITHRLFADDILANLHNGKVKSAIQQTFELYSIGSSGPDFFFFYGVWPWRNREKSRNFHKFGSWMHHEKIDVLFQTMYTMCKEALNPEYISYTAGVLAHWCLDHQAHPYVFNQTGLGDDPHRFYEAMIDRAMMDRRQITYKQLKPYDVVKYNKTTHEPIYDLYSAVLKNGWNAELKKEDVKQGMIDIDRVERFLYDPYGRRVHFVRWLEKPLKVEGYATNMMIPTKENPDWDVMNEKRRLWHHPQTNEERHDTFMDMYNQGLEIAKDVFKCFEQYLNNELSLEEALKMIGKKNFHTGLEEPDNMKYFDLVK